MPEKVTFMMELERPAKKEGGDRYKGKCDSTEVMFYVPQSVSRPDGGSPIERFEVTLTPA